LRTIQSAPVCPQKAINNRIAHRNHKLRKVAVHTLQGYAWLDNEIPLTCKKIPATGAILKPLLTDLSNFPKKRPVFGHFRLLQGRLADLNDKALTHGCLGAECCELATKRFLSGTPFGLLQRFQSNGYLRCSTAQSAMAFCDGIEQVDEIVL
jgi:hypothetical protein